MAETGPDDLDVSLRWSEPDERDAVPVELAWSSPTTDDAEPAAPSAGTRGVRLRPGDGRLATALRAELAEVRVDVERLRAELAALRTELDELRGDRSDRR